MKNILIIKGSPRKNGNTAILADQLKTGAEKYHAQIETLFLNSMNIQPCQGCGKCQEEGASGCILRDDMTPVYDSLKEADALVIASPVYWFNMTAQVKTFIDRLFAVGVEKKNIFRGKSFAALMSFADKDAFDSGAVNAMRSFQDMCRYLDMNLEGFVYGHAHNAGEVRENTELMDKACKLGERLAGMDVSRGTDYSVNLNI